MFEERPGNKQALDRLWATLAEMGRGDVLTHEQAAVALGVGPPTQRYYALIARIKRRLEDERGISLGDGIALVGYPLCTPKETLELARKRKVQAGRRDRKGLKHLRSLPVEECSFTELRAKQAMEERLEQRERQNREDAQWMAFMMRPREQRPRIARDDETKEAS